MKILLSSYHNPNFVNSTVYRERAIEQLGHQLIRFDDRQFMVPQRLLGFKPLYQMELRRINRRLLDMAQVHRPDVCLVVGGQRILPSTVAALNDMKIKTVLWTTDVPVDFDNILRCAPRYHRLFCGGSEAQDIFKANGLMLAALVPFACDPQLHRRVELSKDEKEHYACDVAFVGSYYPNRARCLEALADFKIRIWGPNWNQLGSHSPLRTNVRDVHLNYDQWAKIYSAAKIVVVVHYQDAKTACHQVSPKLFEAMACGAFVLCDRQKDALSLFEDGRHLVYFTDPQDLKTKVRFYLNQEEQRRHIAAQGCREVVERHRYRDRIAGILAQLSDGS